MLLDRQSNSQLTFQATGPSGCRHKKCGIRGAGIKKKKNWNLGKILPKSKHEFPANALMNNSGKAAGPPRRRVIDRSATVDPRHSAR
ncbi:hypothetical protein EVAR_31109_1 [Eumeta japonica]|uniref:Uncharacterized protein n=1 Tax=Eumeta variegata TaxID=151549 RepID=A0A4C1VDG6_EUMVA|nr:hypothetical protein EVAR_31109_1 [Eumeta japonica]